MNIDTFKNLLQQLTEEHKNALISGKALCLELDLKLLPCVENGKGPKQVIIPAFKEGEAPEDIQQFLLDEAEQLHHNYYRNYSLTQPGFNRLLSALFEEHGMHKFAAAPGEAAELTFFGEPGVLKVADAQHPRYRYSTYCELTVSGLSDAQIEQEVRHWLNSTAAYQQFLSMNVCSYQC